MAKGKEEEEEEREKQNTGVFICQVAKNKKEKKAFAMEQRMGKEQDFCVFTALEKSRSVQ